MSFNSSPFIRSAFPYFSPYSSSPSSSSTSESLSLLDEPERSIEHPNQFLRSKLSDEASAMAHQNHHHDPTLYEASPPRRFVVPDIVVTTATPIAPLLPPYSPPKKGSTKTTTFYPPKHFAGEVTKPTSQAHSTLRPQTPTAITLIPPYDFYYPSQPPTQPPPSLDPNLFTPLPPAHKYSELILPQLRTLTRNIESTMDTHLMRQLPHLHSLLSLLSPLPDFGLLTHNLPAFQAHVETYFATARTQEEQYFHTLLAVKPEPELKMVFRIFDDLYTYNFPRRAACLIYPDDFEHEPAAEMNRVESASRFPDWDEGGVETGVPALVYRQGWGGKAKYVVTASFAGDVGVQYPMYHF
ncbi:uncharacterized protein Bfra_000326 [Botrytis fragariae]|uniref:Uncharacterized protein n=1 Tax=Botrytis fragariae TaxID=1964551 RepID=A0A8H6EN22_9HELO|nr:uncharacterized protein Bfra_000326 [Botrytis fragariae]KAF5878159.1 hypothetical protein Bfra_000326 [Botrytis fragariae]